MPTLIYAPEVRVYIGTESEGTIDVSNDLTQGSMTRRSDGVSTFDFAITNARRKYDLMFTPNDRIVCLMKRVSWVQTFSGYLNSVPLRSAWPQDVQLSASCSLKKLQYYWWDPYAIDSIQLMFNVASMTSAKHGGKSGTGLSGNLLVAVMTKVAGWPKGGIHLGEVPADWMKLAVDIAKQVAAWNQDEQQVLALQMQNMGGGAILQGSASQRILDITNGGVDPNSQSAGGVGDISTNTLGGIPAPANGGAYSDVMIAAILYAGGFRGDALWQGVCIVKAESGGVPGRLSPMNTDGTYDRGLWQINTIHKDVSYAQAYDPVFATQWAYNQSNGGKNWSAWSTNNGHVQFDMNSPAGKFAVVAQQAVKQLPTLVRKGRASKSALALAGGEASLLTQLVGLKGAGGVLSNLLNSVNKATPENVIVGNPQLSNFGMTAGSDPGITGNTTLGNTGYDLARNAALLITKWPKIPYVYGASPVQPPLMGSQQPYAFDCSSLVLYLLNQTLGRSMSSPRTALDQYHASRPISVKEALSTPGALLFSSYSSVSAIDHVVICMGDGSTIIEAPHTGLNVRAAQALQDTAPGQKWVAGGLLRDLSYPGNQGAVSVSGGAGSLTPPPPVKSGGTNKWPVANRTIAVKFNALLNHTDRYGNLSLPPQPTQWQTTASNNGYGDQQGPRGGGSYNQPVTGLHNVLDSSYNLGSGTHTGIDFDKVKYGESVYSVTDGTVTVAGTGPESHGSQIGINGEFGKYVQVHSGNTMVIYANLASVSVAVGDKIKAGKVIGTVGNSAAVWPKPLNSGDHTSGVHLHFEVRKGDFTYQAANMVDPVDFITKGVSIAAPWTAPTGGADPTNFIKSYDQSPLYDASNPVDALFGSEPWQISGSDAQQIQENNSFQGVYALAKGSVVLQYVQQVCSSTMRSYCSAPNGDFIAWFPDYYGIWGSSAILNIETIELMDFNMIWTDDNFVTHQFVQPLVGPLTIDPATGLVSGTAFDLAQLGATDITAGIANIDSPVIMAALFGFPPDNAENFAKFIYKKFGARPNIKQVNLLFSDKSQEFFMALYYFMLQWAYQYQASVPITFMPEAWPGMLIRVKAFNFQAYITSVTHQFQFGPNGYFQTNVNICAPALLNAGGKKRTGPLIGLPLAGGYINPQGIDTHPSGGKPKKPVTKPKPRTKTVTKTSGTRSAR